MASLELFNSSLFNDANLQHYYRFEGNSNDSKASSNGTDTAITYNSGNGKFNQGAGFNGSTSQIAYTDASSWKPTGNFSLYAWIKTSNTGAFKAVITSYSQNTNAAGIELRITDTNKAQVVSAKNTGTVTGTDLQVANGATNVCDGNWHFIVGVWDGAVLRIYVDGSQDGTASWANAPVYAATNYVNIGVEQDSNSTLTFFMNGAIDDAAIFNRALSASEISNIWTGGVVTRQNYSFFM